MAGALGGLVVRVRHGIESNAGLDVDGGARRSDGGVHGRGGALVPGGVLVEGSQAWHGRRMMKLHGFRNYAEDGNDDVIDSFNEAGFHP
jgi:hypothetical protein